MEKVTVIALSRAEWNGNEDADVCTCKTDVRLRTEAGLCGAVGERGTSEICNHSPGNSVTSRDVKTYCFAVTAMNKRRKEVVTTSAVAPEVDRAIGYSDNPSMIADFFSGDIYKEETERR